MDITDKSWEDVRKKVFQRDDNKCRLTEILSIEEYKTAEVRKGFYQRQTLDPAHVIRRSQSSKLKYCLLNIVTLSRTFHNRIDQYKDPLTGESISKEEADKWWIRIVGRETWDWLQENK